MNITICYIIIFLVEAFILKQYCSTLFISKYSHQKEWLFILAFYSILFGISRFEIAVLNTCAFLFINFVLILLLYQINPASAFFHSAVITLIMGFSELIVAGLYPQLTLNFYESNLYFENLIFLTIFSKQIYFYVLFLLSRLFVKSKECNQVHGKEIFLLSVIPLVSLWVLNTFSSILYCLPLSSGLNGMITISSILLLICNIVIWGIYIYSGEKNREFTEMQLQLQKEYDSVEYYKMLLKQDESQNILIHDIKKHLQSISLLNEQQEYAKVAAYINEILRSSDLQTSIRVCDNEFLNAILSRYMHRCKEQHIDFRIDIRSRTINFVKENDLTSLFCNLLDNAYESASKQAHSFIELSVVSKPSANLTIITMVNSCRKNPFHKTTGKLISTKKSAIRHGFGIKSIERIIKNYSGNMEFYYDEKEKCFHSIITLNNPNI